MLIELAVDNFAIIDRVDIELGAGMTVLSGETGAGKSILVGALGLLLGDRAGADVVRDGCDKTTISARFDLADAPDAAAWLSEQELADEDECVLRRVINSQGRSRCWINGQAVPARSLRSLGNQLVEIVGQHAHQRLTRAASQRAIVDEYGGHDDLLGEVAETAAQIDAHRRAIAAIEQTDDDGAMRADVLRYQIRELEDAAVADESIANLEAEQRRLASAERLIADGQHALAALTASEPAGASDQLAVAERTLGELVETDPGFGEISELATSARIQADECADGLRRHLDSVQIDPERLAYVEERMTTLSDLARKHRCETAELADKKSHLERELANLENADERLAELRAKVESLAATYRDKAEQLSTMRSAAGHKLAAAVTEIVASLGMPKATFNISVKAEDPATYVSAHGVDSVTFGIAANPGQTSRSIDRVASGGELSRLGLAIEVAAASGRRVPTMVFDEVDAGIGGGVAEIVGRQLRALGAGGQSLCVTHLPQVAAQAQHQLAVAKDSDDHSTATTIHALDETERVEEIARMLGGIELTGQTRAHAADMLARAEPD
ncbi:DNA repair protein RecN [Salinisphaera sp. USBA-960]|nr:DNA repair protein RecN [Salifodinibacter halophilus]NNC25513.1 DNA repair protein RecN [Salifodinibacter halophilus]